MIKTLDNSHHSQRKSKLEKSLYLCGIFLIITSLFSIDILTKMIAQKNYLLDFSPIDVHNYTSTFTHVFTLGGENNWLDFSLTYVRNTGAAWGFLGNMDERYRPYFFNVVTIIAMALIIMFIRQTPKSKILARFGMILILSGACGNFFDRFVFHYVVDWLHIRWNIFSWYYDFPVFNIADTCVTIGASMLLIDMILTEYKGKKHGPTTISKKFDKQS